MARFFLCTKLHNGCVAFVRCKQLIAFGKQVLWWTCRTGFGLIFYVLFCIFRLQPTRVTNAVVAASITLHTWFSNYTMSNGINCITYTQTHNSISQPFNVGRNNVFNTRHFRFEKGKNCIFWCTASQSTSKPTSRHRVCAELVQCNSRRVSPRNENRENINNNNSKSKAYEHRRLALFNSLCVVRGACSSSSMRSTSLPMREKIHT